MAFGFYCYKSVCLSSLLFIAVQAYDRSVLKYAHKIYSSLRVSSELFYERNDFHPKLSSLLRSDIAQYGISTALAEQYLILNNTGKAIEQASMALAAAEKSGEMDNIYAAYAKGLIGDALFKEEHYKEAALAYKDGLQAYEMHYDGETSPIAIEIVGASKCLATALIDKEDYALATAVCEEVLERSASLFGESSAEYANALTDLAVTKMLTGDLGDNIEGQLRKALDIYRDLPKSSEHLYTTFALGTLSILRGQSHTAEAAVLKGALIEGIAEVNGTVSAIKID